METCISGMVVCVGRGVGVAWHVGVVVAAGSRCTLHSKAKSIAHAAEKKMLRPQGSN